jgi:O-antigen polymerase
MLPMASAIAYLFAPVRLKTFTGYIFFATLSCILFTSFVYDYYPDAILTAKDIWFIIFCGIGLVLIAILRHAIHCPAKCTLNAVDVAVIAFIGYFLIRAFAGNELMFYRTKLITFTALGVLYCSLKFAVLVYQYKLLFTIVMLFIFQAFTLSVIGLLQAYHILPSFNNYFNITGTFSNPAPFAIYLCTLLMFCSAFILILPDKTRQHKVIFWVLSLVVLIVLCTIIQTMSRASWVGLLAGYCSIIMYKIPPGMWRFLKRYKKLSYTLASIIAVVSMIAIINLKLPSAYGRLFIWNMCKDMLAGNWWLGVGFEKFPVAYLQQQAAFFEDPVHLHLFAHQAGDVRFAFNVCLQIACEGGIIGLLCFIALLVITFIYVNRLIRHGLLNKTVFVCLNQPVSIASIWIGTKAALIALVVSGLFSYPLSVLPVNIVFYTCIALVSAFYGLQRKKLVNHETGNKKYGSLPVLCTALLLFTGTMFIYYGSKKRIALKQWEYVLVEQYKPDTYSTKLLALYPSLSDNLYYLTNLSEALMADHKFLQAKQILIHLQKISPLKNIYYNLGYVYEQLHLFKLAEKQYMFMANAFPHLLTPQYLLAKLYFTTQQRDKFYDKVKIIQSFIPKVDSYFIYRMKEEVQRLVGQFNVH